MLTVRDMDTQRCCPTAKRRITPRTDNLPAAVTSINLRACIEPTSPAHSWSPDQRQSWLANYHHHDHHHLASQSMFWLLHYHGHPFGVYFESIQTRIEGLRQSNNQLSHTLIINQSMTHHSYLNLPSVWWIAGINCQITDLLEPNKSFRTHFKSESVNTQNRWPIVRNERELC